MVIQKGKMSYVVVLIVHQSSDMHKVLAHPVNIPVPDTINVYLLSVWNAYRRPSCTSSCVGWCFYSAHRHDTLACILATLMCAHHDFHKGRVHVTKQGQCLGKQHTRGCIAGSGAHEQAVGNL